MAETTYTYCQICEQACGLKVTTEGNRIVDISPDKQHPHSWRDFCVKGARAAEVVTHPNRIMAPMQNINGRYVERSYDEAIEDISSRFSAIIEESGPAAIASYAGNPNGMDFGGALFLSMFMQAIGSHNRYWVSSFDQNALHYVAEKMYGHYFITLQLDLDACDYLLLIGANPAVSGMCWIGYNADGWKRLLARQASGDVKIVIADPHQTESANKADVHLATNPDQDWALLLGMIKVIFEKGLHDKSDCETADGIDTVRQIAMQANLEDLSQRCDIPVSRIIEIAIDFAGANTAAAIARTGSAMGINGSLTEWLSHVLNLITGNTDRQGGRFYNPGLVDPLIAGDEIFKPNKVPSRLSGRPTVAGFHSAAELPAEIMTPGAGQIRALIISGGNPVISGPNGAELDRALATLDCLVVTDLVQRESHRHADWLIPAAHWLERQEFNPLISSLSEAPFVQMGRRAIEKPATIKHEWEFLRDLAIAMRVPLMNTRGVNTVAKLSRYVSQITGNADHSFGPQWLARFLVSKSGKAKWRDITKSSRGFYYGEKRFGQLREKLAATGKRIDVAPKELVAVLETTLKRKPVSPQKFPLQLLSRRRRHTMNSWYMEITVEHHKNLSGECIEIHPQLAAELGVVEGDLVKVSSRTASLEVCARLSEKVKPNTAIMEQGWGSRVFDPLTGISKVLGVNRNLLVANDELDPLSAVPRLNGTPIAIHKINTSATK